MELVINFSGGKDSTAMLTYVCEKYPAIPKHVVMADTGWEHPDAIDWSRGIVARFGLELQVVRNPNKTFMDMVRMRGKFPAPAQRQCTSDLKRDPIRTWIRNNCGPLVVNAMGLRAQESAARAKRPQLSRNGSMTNSRRTVWDWNPILGWSEAEVFAYLAQRGIPVHSVYAHLRRFSCRVCIYMTPADVRAVRTHDPEAFDLVAIVEREIGFTMFPKGNIAQHAAA